MTGPTAEEWEEQHAEARWEDRQRQAAARICSHCIGRGCPACWGDDDEDTEPEAEAE